MTWAGVDTAFLQVSGNGLWSLLHRLGRADAPKITDWKASSHAFWAALFDVEALEKRTG